jgi:hypothetical protein
MRILRSHSANGERFGVLLGCANGCVEVSTEKGGRVTGCQLERGFGKVLSEET